MNCHKVMLGMWLELMDVRDGHMWAEKSLARASVRGKIEMIGDKPFIC